MVKRTSFNDALREHVSVEAQSSIEHCEHNARRSTPMLPDPEAIGAGPIIIIEKRALIRDCLRRCFKHASELDVIAVRDVEGWLELSTTVRASLLILSIVGATKAAEAQRDMARLGQVAGSPPMIILSDGDDLEQIVAILDGGARGYIPTDLTLDIAVEALRLVRAGGVFIPASSLVAARRTGDVACNAPRNVTGIFTARQAAVVDALRRGKANKVIAYELKMRESTVKVHVRNIMKKLNAKNRTEVAFMANELIRTNDDAVAAHAGR